MRKKKEYLTMGIIFILIGTILVVFYTWLLLQLILWI